MRDVEAIAFTLELYGTRDVEAVAFTLELYGTRDVEAVHQYSYKFLFSACYTLSQLVPAIKAHKFAR